MAEVLRRLTEARLVVEGKETDDEPYVEPAHDELVRGWDRLLEWRAAIRKVCFSGGS